MKIGINAQDLEGNRTGVGTVLFNFLNCWKEKVGEIEFVLYFKNEIPTDIKKMGFQCRVVEAPLGFKSNALFKHVALTRAVGDDKVDILFCPDYVVPLLYEGKTAVMLHDIIYETRPEEYSWPSVMDRILLKWASKRSSRKTDLVFTPSLFSKSEVMKYYGVEPEKIEVTPLAVSLNMDDKKNGQEIERVRKKYNLKGKYVMFLGSIIKRRHVREAIIGFLKATKGEDYRFLIVGKEIDSIGEFTKEEKEKIIKVGFVDGGDRTYLYDGAELFIWPSIYEGFGLPIIEAMSRGVPVLTAPFGSIPEVAGDCVLYVKNPKNINEMAEEIYRGLHDEELRKKMIEKGLVRARMFSWKKSADLALDALIKIAKK